MARHTFKTPNSLLAENASATKPLNILSFLSLREYLFKTSHTRARVSHIMQSPRPFLCPCSYLQDKEKESNQSPHGIKLLLWNWLPETFFLIGYLVLLSSSHLQLLMELDLKSPTPQNNWSAVDSLHWSCQAWWVADKWCYEWPFKCKGCIPLLHQGTNTAREDVTPT